MTYEPIKVPPVDSARERALLAAFDAHWSRRRAREARRGWTAAVAWIAVAVVAVTFGIVVPRGPVRVVPVVSPPALDLTGFVPWPGAAARPPFESGEIRQVELPASVLPSLGLWPPVAATRVVRAEIVVAQDGFARAVRLVQD